MAPISVDNSLLDAHPSSEDPPPCAHRRSDPESEEGLLLEEDEETATHTLSHTAASDRCDDRAPIEPQEVVAWLERCGLPRGLVSRAGSVMFGLRGFLAEGGMLGAICW